MSIPTTHRRIAPVLLALAAVAAVAATAASPAFGSDELFRGESPLTKFVSFITGPFATGIVIVALVVTVGTLALGGEFSGFARRMPIIVVAGGIVILSRTVLENLFGSAVGYNLPPEPETEILAPVPPPEEDPGAVEPRAP